MSRVPIWCEIVCYSCSVTCSGQYSYSAIPRKALKADALKRGWSFKYDECFCSKKCQYQYEREEGLTE